MKSVFRTAIIVLLSAFVSVVASGEELNSHAPISISSDDDFTEENGVIGGTGTVEDPYVIAEWAIDAASEPGIRIQGTSRCVLIRGCRLTGSRRRGTGVLLGELATARVEESTFLDLRTGIFVYRNPNASMEANQFQDCQRGVEASESDGITVSNSRFIEPREHGVFLWRCHEALLEGNETTGGQNGIYLDSCHRARLTENRDRGGQRGIFLWDCFDCTVIGNEFRECVLGLALVHTSERNTVFHNAFVDNARAATCDVANNRWDNGYPSGGNYWGDDEVMDVRSGPSQDHSGSDGIADNARAVPFEGVDRYPLVAPPLAVR